MADDTFAAPGASGGMMDGPASAPSARIDALEQELQRLVESRAGEARAVPENLAAIVHRRRVEMSRDLVKAYHAGRAWAAQQAVRLRPVLKEAESRLRPLAQNLKSAGQAAGREFSNFAFDRLERFRGRATPSSSQVIATMPDEAPLPNWFYVGDVVDWLKRHGRVTGVGRVTCELFLASLAGEAGAFLPCVPAETPTGLAAVSYRAVLCELAGKAGDHPIFAQTAAHEAGPVEPILAVFPQRGDHVVFTGVNWHHHYRDLFRRLHDQRVFFSVLIHDIIPIERPDLVSATDHAEFSAWLETTAALARFIFVSSPYVRDQLIRWSVLTGHDIAADIVVTPFGINAVPTATSDDRAELATIGNVELAAYVLSVGTIDKRKNQILLCRLWSKLAAELGEHDLPQLVLVGRDDLNLGEAHEDFAGLIAAKKIVILQGLSDAALFQLYRSCLFTVFPSLSEGYGIPVAESLAAGKLCIASDLKAIRAHAGSLPWYFDPSDEEALLGFLREAIRDPDRRVAAEQQIAENYKAGSWSSTFDCVAKSLSAARQDRSWSADLIPAPQEPAEGFAAADLASVLAQASRWCVSDNPQVSVLIVNRNGADATLTCLSHIFATTSGVSYEIIVIDNGSSDQNFQRLRLLADLEGVRVLKVGEDRHFGEANNIGVEHAKGRYICLLSNKTCPQKDWLSALVATFDGGADIGGVGPLVRLLNGQVQQTAASFDVFGDPYPVALDKEDGKTPVSVDYIPATAFVLLRDSFMAIGGFDLTYEPAYYEDIDLCFKLQALGKQLLLCPQAVVVQESDIAASDVPTPLRRALEDVSRGKFLARWGTYLRTRDLADARAVLPNFDAEVAGTRAPVMEAANGVVRKTAVVFSPFALTPGGGERYILTFAWALTRDFTVTIATPHPYSRLRLRALAEEFGLDLSSCALATTDELAGRPRPDLMISLGNHVVPPIEGLAEHNLYMCQFPFPIAQEELEKARPRLNDYDRIIVNSAYSDAYVFVALNVHRLPAVPVEILYPPVSQSDGTARLKKTVILSVGRFFEGGHNKRHDLIIEAFRLLSEKSGPGLALHLAGSSLPYPEQIAYLAKLQKMAAGLDIIFHVNAPAHTLAELYRDAAVYWHATGLEVDLKAYPGAAEHFGMTIVEAMSAACVPLAFNCGGPREIIQPGKNGFLYGSVAELVDLTAELLDPQKEATRIAVAEAAQQRARDFSVETFVSHVGQLTQNRGGLN